MNLQQFAALKVGDRISNDMTSGEGVVTKADVIGIKVAWGPNPNTAGAVEWSYTPQSTAWFHWSKIRDCPNGGRCTDDRCERADECQGTKENAA